VSYGRFWRAVHESRKLQSRRSVALHIILLSYKIRVSRKQQVKQTSRLAEAAYHQVVAVRTIQAEHIHNYCPFG